jgi:hypothetical protein
MVRTIVADKKLNCEYLLGQFLDESHFDTIIDEDCNFFGPPSCGLIERNDCDDTDCTTCPKGIDEDTVIFILRKNFFTEDEQLNALEGLKGAASISFNRGLAAGPRNETDSDRDWVSDLQMSILDYFSNPYGNLFNEDNVANIYETYANANYIPSPRGFVWLPSKVKADGFDFDVWVENTKKLTFSEQEVEAELVKSKYISNTNYAGAVHSGVAGWYDRYPRIPYGRATSYTEKNPEKFALAFPFLQKLSAAFSKLLPRRWAFQKSCIEKIDQAFHVPDTVFTTITVNKSFRTAAHRDAGDLHEGFSNLSVLTNGKKYSGGMLVLPEFRVAVNVRPGDLLLINNHGGIHGNTPIVLEEDDAERYSVVCYFREKMLELGEKVYEDARFNFVESRRTDKDHPEWRSMWNGTSPGMWTSDEWYAFLEKELGKDALIKYHPESVQKSFTLDAFF